MEREYGAIVYDTFSEEFKKYNDVSQVDKGKLLINSWEHDMHYAPESAEGVV